jgi:RHS repeat-associated protein
MRPDADATIFPSTPNAASLGKYGEYPVNLNTGVPDISIPLYTIGVAGFKLPISLSYHSSGFKVNDVASDVGLGWSLNAGGVITRTVLGSPDELNAGLYSGYWANQGNIPSPSYNFNYSNYNDDLLLWNIAQGYHDAQPDEFYYNFGGRSGKFVISHESSIIYKAYTIPYSDLQINLEITNNQISSFTIITEDGTKYEFAAVERAAGSWTACDSRTDESLFGYNTSWFLTKITLPASSKTIQLNYETYVIISVTQNASKRIGLTNFGGCPLVSSADNCFTISDIYGQRLSNITYDYNAGHIDFFYASNRREDVDQDNFDESKALESIKIYSGNNTQPIKEYMLGYSYFQSSGNLYPQLSNLLSTNTDYLFKRLKLDQITEKDGTGNSSSQHVLPPYIFDYESTLLPPRFSFSQDYFGYYNGALNNSLLLADPNYQYYTPANRSINPITTKACILDKITYPTGGYTKFDFENNTYGELNAGQLIYDHVTYTHSASVHATVRHSDCTPSPDCIDIATFTLDQSQNITVTDYYHHLCSDCVTSVAIYELVNGLPVVDQSSGLPIDFLGNNVVIGEQIHLLAGDYELIAEADASCETSSGCTSGSSNATIEYTSLGPSINYRIGPALRIKKITTYDGINHNSDIIKQFDYNLNSDPGRSSGTFISEYNFEYQYSHTVPQTCTQLIINAYSQNFGTANGSYINYKEVTSTYSSLQNNGKEISKFECIIDDINYQDPSPQPPFTPLIYPEYKNLLKEKIFKDDNNRIIKDIINNYSERNPILIPGLKATYSAYNTSAPTDPMAHGYYWRIYEYPSAFNYLSSTIERLYDKDDLSNTNYVETTSNYNYDNSNHTNPTSISTNNSEGIISTTYLKYPQDFTDPTGSSPTDACNALHKMINEKHIHNQVIEKLQTIKKPSEAEKIVSNSFTTFKEFAGGVIEPEYEYSLPLPASLDYSWYSSNHPYVMNLFNFSSFNFSSDYQLKLQYDKYDNVGNLLQYHKKDAPPVSIEWDVAKNLSIAQFKNAHYNDPDVTIIGNECSFSGFESGMPDDGWSTTTIDNIGHTGAKSALINYESSVYGPTKDFFPDNQLQKFRLSCWIKIRRVDPNSTALGYLIIHSKHNNDADNTAYPNTQGSYIQTQIPPDNFGDVWHYYEAVIDLKAMHDYLIANTVDEPLRLRCYPVRPPACDMWIDDIRFEALPSQTQSLTYNTLFTTQPSSVSDERSTPAFYEYDSFGRLSIANDFDHNVLKDYQYNYKVNTGLENYIRSRVPNFETQNSTDLDLATNWDTKQVKFDYFDGLGRPMQSVNEKGSPSGADLVQPIAYDEFGREKNKYLPYSDALGDGSFKPNALADASGDYENSDQHNFYQGTFATPQSEFPYTETGFEPSPLNRVTEQGAPGEPWRLGLHTVKLDFTTNGDEEVLLWKINISNGNIYAWDISSPLYYNANELYKTVTTDENEKQTIEYKDKLGRIILKRQIVNTTTDFDNTQVTMDKSVYYPLNRFNYSNGDAPTFFDTYYVYNDLGQLAYVIPASAINELATGGFYSFFETNTIFNNYIYGYHYDGRGRIFEKKIPGQDDWTYYVYNKIDEVVLTQTPVQRGDNDWTFNKYDALGRVVITGNYHDESNSRSDLQNLANTDTYIWEDWIPDDDMIDNYTWDAFPVTYNKVYTLNNYDHYALQIPADINYVYSDRALNKKCDRTQGLLTESISTISPANLNLLSVNYYDEKTRFIQQHANNQVEGYDMTDNQYDFKGQLSYSMREHSAGTDFLRMHNRYQYDHEGRKIATYMQTSDTDPEILLSFNEYNESGQLIRKNLHNGPDNPGYLQQIDYRYNIRGWLTSINNASLVADGIKNLDDNDAFGEEISYDNTEDFLLDGADFLAYPQYNGNIAAIQWKTRDTRFAADQKPEHLYVYRYDELNRMTAAYYADNSSNFSPSYYDKNFHMYDEKLTYDLMGNIRHLYREDNPGAIDDLHYDYSNSGNRITNITDEITAASAVHGFHDLNSTSFNDFYYDLNGNLSSDNTKGLGIGYNHLSLPLSVTNTQFQVMQYVYDDVTGRKLTEIKPDGTLHQYINGIEYDKGKLIFIATEEGRVRPKSQFSLSNHDYVYDYFIKDHLGNIRAVLSEELIKEKYAATMETQNMQPEDSLFMNMDTTRASLPAGYPIDSSTYNPEYKISLSNVATTPIGSAKVLQVNEGDSIDISTQYYYTDTVTPNDSNILIPNILTNLANTFIYTANSIAGSGLEAQQQWASATFTDNPDLQNFLQNSINPGSDANPTAPKAYLINLFFTDSFQFVPDASYVLRATDANALGTLAVSSIVAPAKGYMYTYVSNQSTKNVSFDNLQVQRTPGTVLELNDYYPYGYLINDLSFSSNLSPLNKYKFNGKELQTDLNWGVEDFGARHYDPVVPHWLQVDPLAEQYRRWTPFNFGDDNPVRFIDPDGMGYSDFKDIDGNLVAHVDDGSNAVYQQTGSEETLHYEFSGEYNENQGGKNEVTKGSVTSAIQEQQNLNSSNPSLQQFANGVTDKQTHCNQATECVLATAASALNNSAIKMSGTANEMVGKLATNTNFKAVDQKTAESTASNGGLAIVGYPNPNKGGSGHLATFSVGTNVSKGKLANIGPKNYTGFKSLNESISKDKPKVFYILK